MSEKSEAPARAIDLVVARRTSRRVFYGNIPNSKRINTRAADCRSRARLGRSVRYASGCGGGRAGARVVSRVCRFFAKNA
jgi:hypothetical protein